jgi:hypothetical protein
MVRMSIWITEKQKKFLMMHYAKTGQDQTETIRQGIDLYEKKIKDTKNVNL